MDKLEIISNGKEMTVNKLEDLSKLTDKAIKGLKWPAGMKSKMFVLTGKTDTDLEVFGALTAKDSVWGLYAADKTELIVNEDVPFLPSIKIKPLKALSDVRKAYLETREGWYRDRKVEMTPRQVAETRNFLENFLPESSYLCLEKSGKLAGLLLLNEYSDYLGKMADLIPWVWVEASLDAAERQVVHAAMAAWLQRNVEERVQAYVAASNPRSMKFFKELGFRLEAVRVLKDK